MTYEDIVFVWNANAPDDHQYDTLSDRERIEFALSLAGEVEKQESVAWVEVIDRHEGPYYFHGKELLDVGKHNLYTAPQPCQECEKLKAERDELAAQVEKMREFLQFLWRDAQLNEYTFARLEEMIALPDLSTSILDKVRAEALDAKRYRWLRSSSVGPAQIWELLSDDCNPPVMTLKSMGDLDAAIDSALAADMEAGKC